MSMSIDPGEIYGLIGPNGAGKTTFFNVLTGLYRPDEGEFLFDGAPLPDGSRTAWRRGHRAHVPEHPSVRDMTALENVMVGRHVRTHAGVIGAVLRNSGTRAEERAIEARRSNCWTTSASRSARRSWRKNLPYGDQRRLEIARALATEPEAARARRAGRGHERDRDGAPSQAARRRSARRHDDPADRARREAGDGRCATGCWCSTTARSPRDCRAGVQRDPKVIEAYLGGEVELRSAVSADQAAAAELSRLRCLRRHPGRQGHRSRGGRGRAGHADRRQRRRQDDDLKAIAGGAAARPATIRLRGERHHGHPGARAACGGASRWCRKAAACSAR